jgi:hypothetical protein
MSGLTSGSGPCLPNSCGERSAGRGPFSRTPSPHFTIRYSSRTGTEPVKNPVTGVESFPRAILPQGFIVKEAALLRSSSLRLDGPIEYDHTGKYAAVGPFSYQQS